MQSNKKNFVIVSILLTAMLMVACNNTPAPATPSTSAPVASTPATTPTPTAPESSGAENMIRIGQWNPPTGLFHPALLTTDWDGAVTGLIFESLVNFDGNYEFYGKLAKSWDISDDGLSVTFHLVDANWHDGTPFTADDVKFSMMWIGHPDYPGTRYSDVSSIAGMKDFKAGTTDDVVGLEVIDAHTIKITTEDVYPPFFTNIGGRAIIAKHIWQGADVATAFENTALLHNPVGTGPFVIDEFVPDSHAVTRANPNYWDGAPKIDGVIIMAVNQQTAPALLINGEVDIVGLSDFDPNAIKMLTDAGVQVQTAPLFSVMYMGVNNRLESFASKEARQGLAHAIDRQGIVDHLIYGAGNVANNPYTPLHWAYPGPEVLDPYEYNSAKAIEKFEAAGYSYDSASNTMFGIDGNPVQWTIIYPYGNVARERAAEVIQGNLADIGIDLVLDIMEFNQLTDRADAFDFELLILGRGTGLDADQLLIWESTSGLNYAGFADAHSDELLKEGLKYIDIDTRKEIYRDWAIYMNEQMPVVWLYNWDGGQAVHSRVHGVHYFWGASYYDIINWEIK